MAPKLKLRPGANGPLRTMGILVADRGPLQWRELHSISSKVQLTLATRSLRTICFPLWLSPEVQYNTSILGLTPKAQNPMLYSQLRKVFHSSFRSCDTRGITRHCNSVAYYLPLPAIICYYSLEFQNPFRFRNNWRSSSLLTRSL